MILAVDAYYREDGSVRAAGALFLDFAEEAPAETLTVELLTSHPYQPGSFYLRELPAILKIVEIAEERAAIDVVIVDGYVWLPGDPPRPGLGARLWEVLGEKAAVIGVAKNPVNDTSADDASAALIFRGKSGRPLYVTAAGLSAEEAAGHVRAMAGGHRIPTLLKLVDRLSREGD